MDDNITWQCGRTKLCFIVVKCHTTVARRPVEVIVQPAVWSTFRQVADFGIVRCLGENCNGRTRIAASTTTEKGLIVGIIKLSLDDKVDRWAHFQFVNLSVKELENVRIRWH